jgi:HK97 family phage major capsid protein
MALRSTDQMLARYVGEIEERQQFIDGLVQAAQEKGEDLDSDKLELIEHARDRINDLNRQMGPLEEARRISADSSERIAAIAHLMAKPDKPKDVEYRSAGAYMLDRYYAMTGNEQARERLDMYHRAAAHQTTADNAGLIPSPIIQPVVNFVDTNRTLVSQLGPRQLPGQNWSRPKVTQHTTVATQSAEKAELVSQKMLITKLTATAVTLGGYVNVSRQDADFTAPGILDVVINDLAAMYAIQTEAAACTAFDTAATAGLALPTGANTADQVAASLWDAAGKIYTATKGAGRVFAVIPPGMLSSIGPMFPPGPAVPSQAPDGFTAANFQTGLVGNISGIPIYVSAGLGTLRILVLSTAAAEVYEDRIGSLQVVEPSVLGIQVAYAGYFTPMVIEATGIVKIVKTP